MEGHGHSGPTLHGLALPEAFWVGRATPSYLVSDVISCQDGLAFPLYQSFSDDKYRVIWASAAKWDHIIYSPYHSILWMGIYYPPGRKVSQSDVCTSQKGSFYLNREFSFYSRDSHFLSDHLPVWCLHSCFSAFRKETVRGLHLQISTVCLACPAIVPCLTLSLGCLHSCILDPNLSAKRFSLCVSTPSQFLLRASGL